MNKDLTIPDQGPWQVGPHAQLPHVATLPRGQRNYSSTHVLDFQTLVRIIQHWRWLILGSIAAGLAL